MENDVIIFCQAAADLSYVMDISYKYGTKNCTIFVMNVESIYNFLNDLNIEFKEISYIPKVLLNPKSLRSIASIKKNIDSLWKEKFSCYTKEEIYFFSTSYDYLTAAIVSRLSKNLNHKVYYYNHYDHLTTLQGEHKFSIRRYILSYLYRYIASANFIHTLSVNFPKFDYERYDITKIQVTEKPEIKSNFLYKVDQGITNAILFFISPDEIVKLTNDSKTILLEFIQGLKDLGYSIFLKGHPRLGEPEEIKKIADFTIPLYIPSEFLDYSRFKFVIGISSAALCYPAEKRLSGVYSLLDMLSFNDDRIKEGFKKYIIAYSNDNILFNTNNLLVDPHTNN